MIRERLGRRSSEALIVIALFGVSYAISHLAIRAYRDAGVQPFFYQSNFEPAVMMACGRGFGVLPLPSPELVDFLQSRRDTLDCRVLPAGEVRPATLTANANWYYMYDAAAAVWRVTGVSWTALDILVAAFAGIVTALLYGLFRMVAAPGPAVALSLLLTIAPSNLMRLLSLRDYSKAPFALAGILVLAIMVVRPMSRARILALAALYGAVVGLGYGFRSDLAVMVPFGAAVVLFLLPGDLRGHIGRNTLAAAALVAAFGIVAAPVIAGLKSGGCQYHFALLGLTGPATTELHLTPPSYRLGNHALDIFGNLKVGDYATRVMHQPLTEWCGADFDVASGQLYFRLARMFPADFVIRAYGSVLMILRLSFGIPAGTPSNPFPANGTMTGMYRVLDAVTAPLAPLGVFAVLAAIAVAWGVSARLGIAFTAFVLFLAGYPAIRFEDRHWFHLRFLPWWGLAMVIGAIARRRFGRWDRAAWLRAVAGTTGVLVALALSLAVLRAIQTRSVRGMISEYLAAPTEDLAIDRGGASVAVRWHPRDYGAPAERRGSDLIVVTLDAAHCGGDGGPLTLMVRYDVDTRDGGHDLSSAFTLARPAIGAEPTRVFVPVFWAGTSTQTFLRFSGFEVTGAPSSCVGRVGRVIDGGRLPLWLEMQVPPDWSSRPLYQSIEPPRFLKPFIKGSL